MPTVEFTRNLARHVACPTEAVAGDTVGSALDDYFARHPAVRPYVLDDQGRVRHHVTVFVDGQQLRDRGSLGERVGDATLVSVMQALSGG